MKKKRRSPPSPAPLPPPARPSLFLPLLTLYGLSGFCVLALETLWMREVSLWAGNTIVAATLVTAAFFVAAALGNLAGAAFAARVRRPLPLFAWAEMAAAVVGAGTFLLGQWLEAADAMRGLDPISATALLVGPSCFLSGLGFPFLAEALVESPRLRTVQAGPLYGANLLGAALGVIGGGVLLPWWLGVRNSFFLVAILQLAGGALALLAISRAAGPSLAREGKAGAAAPPRGWTWGLALLSLSGFLSLGTQTALLQWARQVLQGSVYAIGGVLGAFIAGLGGGALLAALLRKRGRAAAEILVVAVSLAALMLFLCPRLGQAMVRGDYLLGARDPLAMLGQSLGWSLLILLPLTICLGMVFPLAWELTAGDQRHQGTALGRMLAINKISAAAGAALAAFVLLPALGLRGGTFALGWGYLALALIPLALRKVRASGAAMVLAVGALGVWQGWSAWSPLGLQPEGESVVAAYSGAYGPVTVVEHSDTGSRQILLNSQQRLSGTRHAMSSQLHQAWAPLLFCRRPDRVLTIGMAAGITAAAALEFPVKELVAVELVPEVVAAAKEHFGEWNQRLFSDPRAHVVIGDGRAVLARQPGKFDAIICDLFFPAEDGTANLYSRDFFARARERLEPDGVFCLWLPCYQMDAESAGLVIRTFMDIFPNAVLIRANLDPIEPVIGLLGSGRPIPVSQAYLTERLAALGATDIPQRSPYFLRPENAALLFAGDLYACDPAFTAHPVTTDDRPLFAFLGPRAPLPGQRLMGYPFLNWIGKSFLQPRYPSCDLGATPAEDLLLTTRAANYYLAASAAGAAVPGDTRLPAVREAQVDTALHRARELRPQAALPESALGQ